SAVAAREVEGAGGGIDLEARRGGGRIAVGDSPGEARPPPAVGGDHRVGGGLPRPLGGGGPRGGGAPGWPGSGGGGGTGRAAGGQVVAGEKHREVDGPGGDGTVGVAGEGEAGVDVETVVAAADEGVAEDERFEASAIRPGDARPRVDEPEAQADTSTLEVVVD